jgi:hypothetical protein
VGQASKQRPGLPQGSLEAPFSHYSFLRSWPRSSPFGNWAVWMLT